MKTQEEINEGNKLIAKIDNRLKFKNDKKHFAEWMGVIYGERGNAFMSNQLKYHSSWDWLIPVYHKIAKEEPYGDDENGIVLFNILYDSVGDACDILEVWNNIVEFLKWYKNNLK